MTEFERILENEILPLVTKPGRYIGNEFNVIKKDWSKVAVTFALIFPDLYEIGMSYLGFEILYHILNKEKFIAAERIFAPGSDMEQLLRDKGLSLFSLETKTPLQQFDVLGFTLQYELHATNILNILDLGGIVLRSKERDNSQPIVLAGGPGAFNPEPLADFIDAFVIGDGEEVVLEIAHLIKEAKARNFDRQKLLQELAKLSGVYVPQFYEASYDEQGRFKALTPTEKWVAPKISARIIEDLQAENYPCRPLVPIIATTHDRFSMEIMRGCSRGCRFCNAGTVYRPVRERPVDELVSQATQVIENTGFDEVSLVSLSTSDYNQLFELLAQLGKALEKRQARISFPSLRPETFTPELAHHARAVRKSGLTLAPEAGTERLRKVINKTNTNEDLLKAVEVAFREGWNLVKLYFMVGLPTETEEDLEGIVKLIHRVLQIARKFGRKEVHVSLSPFTPKAHTPFQWEAQDSVEEIEEKIFFIKDQIRSQLVKLNWRDARVSFLEAVIARGDRRLASVIQRAWELGARFDAWSDHFKFDIWKAAFTQCEVNPHHYVRQRMLEERLPWDHIDKGIDRSFLLRERTWAFEARETIDCRKSACHACGLMEQKACKEIIFTSSQKGDSDKKMERPIGASQFGRSRKKIPTQKDYPLRSVRIKYSKGCLMRFTSHLDLARVFERAFRRSGIPIAYSQGFHPHPRIAYGPALGMGFISDCEYLDFQFYKNKDWDVKPTLTAALPPGIEILEVKPIYGKAKSLASVINRADYHVILCGNFDRSDLKNKTAEFLNRKEVMVERKKGDSSKWLDIRPFVHNIEVDSQGEGLIISTNLDQGKTVRIDEILKELLALSKEEISLCKVKRIGLFVQFGDLRLTPMDI